MNQFEYMKMHQCKAVDIKETVKTAEISDPFGNLRFKVAMTSYDVVNDGRYVLCYQIQVINYFGVLEPIIVADRPDDGEQPIYDYNYALGIYNEYVRTYSSLVRAECRDHQDIDVYKENIGYKKTLPECCATCKWCRRRKIPHEFIYGVSEKLECTNPLNCQQFENDIVREHDPFRQRHEEIHGHRVLPDDCSHDTIYPDVDPFGKCDHYIVAARPNNIAPGMNVTDFIDMRLGTRMDSRMQTVARSVISSEISTDLSAPVICAVANALSSNQLSDALTPAVATVVPTNEVSSAVIHAVVEGVIVDKVIGNDSLGA